MAKPQEEPHSKEYLREVEWFYQILFQTIQSPDFLKSFLKDLLTESELRMIQNRWRIARLLDEGKPIREVASEARVGTDTVERISKRVTGGTGGLQKALEMVREEVRKLERRKGVKQLKKEEFHEEDGVLGRWVFGTGKQVKDE